MAAKKSDGRKRDPVKRGDEGAPKPRRKAAPRAPAKGEEPARPRRRAADDAPAPRRRRAAAAATPPAPGGPSAEAPAPRPQAPPPPATASAPAPVPAPPPPAPRPPPPPPPAQAASPRPPAAAPPLAAPARVIPPLPDEEDEDVPFEGPHGGRAGAEDEGGDEDEGPDAEDDGAPEPEEREAGPRPSDFGDDGSDGSDGSAGPGSQAAQGPGGPGAPGGGPSAGADARALLEAVRRGERHVSSLEALSDAEIAGLAARQGWRPRPGERRSETLFRLLQGQAQQEQRESVFTEGLLELHPDGYGFLRRPQNHYAQHPYDVYVAAGLVRRLGLKPGHWVSGEAHRARPGEPYFALHDVQEVNHEEPGRLQGLKRFEELTVVYPDQRYVLEVNPLDVEMRLMDLFCPLGRGQRGLIVAPPRTGKTVLLQKIADAVAHNAPNADIVVLLVDERPEEVTNMRRSVRGEVIASTFDKPVANHVRVAELVIEKVKRMVELGRHVVLLLDSITRLGRAYNNLAPTSGRILSGGMDAGALTKPKLFFASARNVEDGGSLTILATALVDTGSRLDQVIFEEFKGTGNMELVLDRDLANQRIWPAINIPASGTRNEDLLLHPEELRRITRLRRALSDHGAADAMLALKDLMKQYRTNAELIMSIQ